MPRVLVLMVGAGLFLGAGFGLARWLGREPDVPVVTVAPPRTPDVALGDPHRVLGAEVPDPAFLDGGTKLAVVDPHPPATPHGHGHPVAPPRQPHSSMSAVNAHANAPSGGATEPASPALTPEPATTQTSTPGPSGAEEPSEEPETPEGQLDTRAVIFVVRHYLPQVRSCYERELRNEPDLRGQVTMRFTIGAGGRVTGTEPVLNSTGSQDLAACVGASLRTWHFPEPEGGPVAFEYPFRFGRPAASPELPGPTEAP
jgi:hypothetical protein